jgi:hypothetical protein
MLSNCVKLVNLNRVRLFIVFSGLFRVFRAADASRGGLFWAADDGVEIGLENSRIIGAIDYHYAEQAKVQ